MEVKNRVAMTAGGGVNDDMIAFYEGRAGAALG
jgi:hypothetical protein